MLFYQVRQHLEFFQILLIVYPKIPVKTDIIVAVCFWIGIDVILVDTESEDRSVFLKYGSGAVTLVHVTINNHCPVDVTFHLKFANRYRHIVQMAKTFLVAGKGVMKPPTQVHPHPFLKSDFTCQIRTSAGCL